MVVNGITVSADPSLTNEEIVRIVEEELFQWSQQNKPLGRLELVLDGENILIRAYEKSPIRRVRRITGYLSNIENFNDAKRSECANRLAHTH